MNLRFRRGNIPLWDRIKIGKVSEGESDRKGRESHQEEKKKRERERGREKPNNKGRAREQEGKKGNEIERLVYREKNKRRALLGMRVYERMRKVRRCSTEPSTQGEEADGSLLSLLVAPVLLFPALPLHLPTSSSPFQTQPPMLLPRITRPSLRPKLIQPREKT